MNPTMKDIGAYLAARFGAIVSALAAGTGDATEVNGACIDRRGFQSLSVFLFFTATLTAAKTLSLAGNLQDATDASAAGAADFGDAYAATVVATGPGGGGTVTGVVKLDFRLHMARSHVRFQFTPDLNHTATDTAIVCLGYVLGGAESLPAV